MKKIVIFIFLLSQLNGIQFKLKHFLADGILWKSGRLLIGDTDRDSLFELIFLQHPGGGNHTVLYEQRNFDSIDFAYPYFIIDTAWSIDTSVIIPYLLGDFDLDGLYEIACVGAWGYTPPIIGGPTFYEQQDSFSYPLIETWRDTTHYQAIIFAAGDADKDGLPDILTTGEGLVVYETRGNDLFEKVFEMDPICPIGDCGENVSSPMDFDGDGKNEFVIGATGWHIHVAEARGNDTYCIVWTTYLPTPNNDDVMSLPDLDKDGKNEFMVKGWSADGKTFCFIFEAGTSFYEIIWDTVYMTNTNGTGLSALGDVDMDGEPEIVLEYGDGFKVLKCIGDNKFTVISDILVNPGISQIKVAPDIDRNGINEVVVSGYGETYFFEAILNANEKKLKIPSFSKTEFKNYKIFDLTGREVKKIEKGIYFIKLKEEGKTFKIIKIK